MGSCTANAGVRMIEFYENKAYGVWLDTSRLFIYKATRNLLRWMGDTGAYLHTTMGAMALFGVPPEKYSALAQIYRVIKIGIYSMNIYTTRHPCMDCRAPEAIAMLNGVCPH